MRRRTIRSASCFPARHDSYDIPNSPGDLLDDVQRETDSFGILSWVRKLGSDAVLTTSVFYHFNEADLDAAPNDQPISTTDQRSSTYIGGQETPALPRPLAMTCRSVSWAFGQQDSEHFNVLFNDGSGAPVNQTTKPTGALVAAYVEDTFKATSWLSFMGGVRGDVLFRGRGGRTLRARAWGRRCCCPVSGGSCAGSGESIIRRRRRSRHCRGPLLEYATNSDSGFLPLHGERDEEYQFGLTIPLYGWTVDVDHFRTQAKNFFDHNPIGNIECISAAHDRRRADQRVTSWRSARRGSGASARCTWRIRTRPRDGFGTINGGLTDFSPPAGYFALDHDQRNTANAGLDVNLP